MKRKETAFLTVLLLLLSAVFGYAQEGSAAVIVEISTLRLAYPDIRFEYSYNQEIEDWEIVIFQDDSSAVLYRAEGRYLRKDQRDNQERYWSLLYNFPKELRDPAFFTAEEKEWISHFSSSENRRSGRIGSTSFFDVLYDCETRENVEQHIVYFDFLGQQVGIHKKIIGPLQNVERKIIAASAKYPELADFIQSPGSISAYSWRPIRDSSARSLHSMGLAIDILPENLQGKAIYWNWEKSKGNENWMLIPLSDRWIPPEAVIRIFESEGFIWGGMWPIWDNMHFEYRPELLLWRDR